MYRLLRVTRRLGSSSSGSSGMKKYHFFYFRVRIDQVVTPGFTRVIRGAGMPISKQPGQRGDLVVTFDIVFPKTLSSQQKEILRKTL